MSLLAHTWEGFGLFASVVVLGFALRSVLGTVTRAEAASLAVWCAMVMGAMVGFQETYRAPLQAYSALAWLVMLTGFCWAAGSAALASLTRGPVLVARGAVWTAASLLPVTALLLVWSDAPYSLLEHLVAPLGSNRLMTTVGELQKPSLAEWYGGFGVVGWLGVVGAAMVGFGVAGESRFRVAAALSVVGFVFFGTVAPGLLSVTDQAYTDGLFLVGLAMWAVGWLVAYLGLRRRRRESSMSQQLSGLASGTSGVEPYLLVWFLVTLAAARSSVRFEVFLLPVVCVLAAMVLREVIQQLSAGMVEQVVPYAASLALGFGAVVHLATRAGLAPMVGGLLLLGLAPPLLRVGLGRAKLGGLFEQVWPVLLIAGMVPMGVGCAAHGATRLSGVRTSPYGHLTEPMRWLREQAPTSIVAAWWDYGSWLNRFGHVRTIIDEDHYEPYRIHLFAKHVYGAQSAEEALSFLKTYRARYLLLTRHDLSNLKAVSFIGMFGPSGKGLHLACTPIMRETVLTNGHTLLDSMTPQLWPYAVPRRHRRSVPGFLASLETDGTGTRPAGGSLVLLDGESRVARVPRFVQINGERLDMRKPTCEYGLVCQSMGISGRTERHLYVVGPEHARLLAVRLFLLGERAPGFTPVFRDGTAAIWRVEPGVSAVPNPEYLCTDFHDEKLRRGWMLNR